MARVASMSRGAARPTIVLAALAAIALSLVYLIRPAFAVATTEVWLHDAHKGSDSTTFQNENDCGPFGNTGGGVVWHFVLNQLDDNTPGGSLTAWFTGAGEVSGQVGATEKNVHHYWVLTSGDDVLENAKAVVNQQADAAKPNLLLSHVCHQSGGQSASPSTQESIPQSVQESVAESIPQSVQESVQESLQESVAESVPQSVQESVQESVAESVEQSVAESVAESVEQSVAESASQSVEQSVEQSVAESASQSTEQSVQAATGTPEASLPNGAMGGEDGSSPLPTILFSLLLLASLGTLAYANVRSVRSRS